MLDKLFINLQHVIPQHCLSRITGKAAASELPWLKNLLIAQFAKRYKVDMSEAINPDLRSYHSFNDFFTRALAPGARPVDQGNNVICCPADGAISEIGQLNEKAILQAKGRHYSSIALLGGRPDLAKDFIDGSFATVYLSPRDYHRVHMPIKGTLRETIYVPGQLYSVNNTTAANVNNLFARNERLVCIFDTEIGPMAYVMVGAMIVAGIETIFSGRVCPVKNRILQTNYQTLPETVELDKGDELGKFFLGSTVIMLFAKDAMKWKHTLAHGCPVQMGEKLGEF